MERLFDIESEHASHLHRYSTFTYNRILKLLEKTDKRLTAELFSLLDDLTAKEIAALTGSDFKTKRLIRLREVVRELAAEARIKTGEILKDNGKKLSSHEIDHSKRLLSFMGHESFIGISESSAYAAAMSRPLQGRHVRDMFADIEPRLKRQIMAAIREGAVLGESAGEITRRLRGTVEQRHRDGLLFTRNRGIELIARTSLNHIANVAIQESYKANGVKKVVFAATLDGRTSKVCASLDGNVYAIDKGPRPPRHPNCRSRMIALVGKELQGLRPYVEDKRLVSKIPQDQRDVIGQVRAGTNYEKWFSGRSVKFQLEWLGKSKYKLYEQGKYKLSRFVDPRGKPYTLDQLRKKDGQTFDRLGL